jgi:hypothetical protein
VASLVAHRIVGSGVYSRFKQSIGAALGQRIGNLANPRKHEAHRAGLPHVAAILGEQGTHIAGRPVAVIGQRLNHDGNPTRPIALITHGIEILRINARGLFDRALDRVPRHVSRPRVLHRKPEAGIHGRVRKACLCRNSYLAAQLGKGIGSEFVLPALPVHNVFIL